MSRSPVEKDDLDEIENPLEVVPTWTRSLFESQDQEKYPFHNYEFVSDFVEEVKTLARSEIYNSHTYNLTVLAAWFAYSGYAEGQPAISEKSVKTAERFFTAYSYPEEDVEEVLKAVRSVHNKCDTENKMESVLHDASRFYLAKKKFKKRLKLLREELEAHNSKQFSDLEWSNHLVSLVDSTRFITVAAKENYLDRLNRNLSVLKSDVTEESEDKAAKRGFLGLDRRAVDTLLRNQMRYQTNLISLVDKKAHIIIGANALSLSILLTKLQSALSLHPLFWVPAGILIATNLLGIVFAILVIAPNTPGRTTVSLEDVLARNGPLFSQVMFSDIEFDHFKLGIQQTLSNENFIFDSITRTMYDTGQVLKSKFQRLRYAYLAFAIGICLSVVSFIIVEAIQMYTSR